MELPVVFQLGRVGVPAHLVLELLGYATGFQTYRVLRRRGGDVVAAHTRWIVIAAAAAGAALGSRLVLWAFSLPDLIGGEKVDEKEEKDERRQWVRRERTSGAFRRVIPLPSDVDFEKVEATFAKGVLKVEMPRIVDESRRPKPVKIQTKD